MKEDLKREQKETEGEQNGSESEVKAWQKPLVKAEMLSAYFHFRKVSSKKCLPLGSGHEGPMQYSLL